MELKKGIQMKKILFIVIVAVCAAYFYYHSGNDSSDMVFDVEDDALHIKADNFDYSFKRLDDYEISGYVMGAEHAGSGPFSVFSTTCGIVWGDTAIEIASSRDDQSKDLSEYSSEAQAVLRKEPCGANYLNRHISSLAVVAESSVLDSVMRNIKEKDMVTLKGYKVKLQSARFDDMPVQFDHNAFVCVTEAVINDETFAE